MSSRYCHCESLKVTTFFPLSNISCTWLLEKDGRLYMAIWNLVTVVWEQRGAAGGKWMAYCRYAGGLSHGIASCL